MSLTLDRLRALKRQAGATDAVPAAAPTAPTQMARSATSDANAGASPRATRAAVRPEAPWDAVLRADGALREAPTGDAADPANAADVEPGVHCTDATTPARRLPASADGVAGATHEPAASGLSTNPRTAAGDSLRRLLGLRERAPASRTRVRQADRTLPGREIDDGLWLIESRVADAPPGAPLPLAFARRDGHVAAGDLLFFDTETTGLAGGTGTRAFMIGAADWFGGALRVRQLLIANMAAERAMLRTFASWLSPSTVLSSYNGRSYDAPLLRTRYRLARLPDALHGLDHLDLLHPSRRRWRGRWENCRLATIEREALRILREDDLPGAQAPAAWLSYLRGGDAVNLRRVAEHNRQDVATLARLLLRLADDGTE